MIEQLILPAASEFIREQYKQDFDISRITVERTRKEFEGDITLVIFPLLKLSRKSPEQTAAELGEGLIKKLPQIESFKVIKGFLNLKLSDSYWISFLKDHCSDAFFGARQVKNEDRVVLEFSSPNTNKPLHLGHVRNNLLGDSLSRILLNDGYPVVKVNLVNDRGIHICKSMLAYLKWGNGETPSGTGIKSDKFVGKYYVLFEKYYREEVHELMQKGLTEEEAENQASMMTEARDLLRQWEAGDKNVHHLWKKMNDWAYQGFDMTYRRLGIVFDRIYYESDTWLRGKEMIMEGLEQGVLEQREDESVWIDLTAEGLDKKLLLRSDGTSVYMTQDLGTAQIRYEDFRPSQMIYVVGNEQNYHFDVLKKVLARIGKPYASRIFHLSYGMVELPEGKMKSREGTVVDADDLIDEMISTAETMTRELGKASDFPRKEARKLFETIGMGALKYFILKVDPKKNMLFDPKESIDFNGNTGPFIQYTHARICSLLAKAGNQETSGEKNGISGTEPLLVAAEREVIKTLSLYPSVCRQSATELNPSLIANYIYELARQYNQFYQEINVLREENAVLRDLRLTLSSFTARVIRKSMELLGISCPERM